MRLLKTEISIIKTTLAELAPGGQVYLHGSRVRDDLKGGDIDLFWVVSDSQYEDISARLHGIVANLSLKLRQQKIDLHLIKKSEALEDDFFTQSEKALL